MIALGILLAAASTVLAFAGLGMTGHMAAHMLAVAVAAPVIALALPLPCGERGRSLADGNAWGGPSTKPAAGEQHPVLFRSGRGPDRPAASHGGEGLFVSPLLWAAIEFFTVWAWHLPALRHVADMHPAVALVEQAMFLGVGVALWRAALAQPAAGVASLLLTSMHMTLLGALIGLAPRPLYAMMAMHPAPGLDALADQQLGGVVMLLVGGASYCLGGLSMLGTLLRTRAA